MALVRVENAGDIRSALTMEVAEVERLLAGPLAGLRHSEPRTRDRHLLWSMLEATRQWLGATNFSSHKIEGYSIELLGVGALLRARAGDPGLPELVAGMVEASQYIHAMGVLGVAYAIADQPWARHVTLLRKETQRPGRIADLRVEVTEGGKFDIEVKAPRTLRDPNRPVRVKAARRIVATAIMEACNPKNPQLPPGSPGMVAIVGHDLRERDGRTLESAGNGYLQRRGGLNPWLMGVLMIELRRQASFGDPTEIVLPDGRRQRTRQLRATFGSRRNYSRNPAYVGNVQLNLEEGHDPAKENLDFRLGALNPMGGVSGER
ncbi:MAG: hypothetical protein L3K16_06140 [Thermoplasmata archaeon]|nr:hypothetical protein [Thermoplasmata archaeon]